MQLFLLATALAFPTFTTSPPGFATDPAATRLPAREQPAWTQSLEKAKERAKQENKVILIAVNIDNEPGNERMLSVYAQPSIAALTSETINVIASVFDHKSEDSPCKRFGTIRCGDHRTVEAEVRDKYLEKDKKGHVISPQHVLLGPTGDIILSVTWEISEQELEWCLVTALHTLDTQSKRNMPASARAPLRVTMGAVSNGAVASVQPFNKAEIREAIREIKKSWGGTALGETFDRLLVTDHKDAIKYVRREIDTGIFGLIPTLQTSTLDTIGAQSPMSFHVAASPLLKHKDESVRNAAAVALEQLAAPDAVKSLKSALSKEKKPEIKKNILRALGTSGSDNRGVRGTLLKFTRSKDALLRRNAIIALASHHGDEDVDSFLAETLHAEEEGDRCAAALSIGFGRRVALEGALRKALESSFGDQAQVYERVLRVLEGGNLKILADDFKAIARDNHRRVRFFGRS